MVRKMMGMVMIKQTISGIMHQKKKQVPVNDKLHLESSQQPEIYDELLPKLSPTMRKMCQSYTVQKKESDEWFSSLQYLNAKIDDLSISESFLDNGSEFGALND